MSLGDSIGNTLVRNCSDRVHSVVGDTAPSNRRHLSEAVYHKFEQWIRYSPVRRSGPDVRLVFSHSNFF